MKLLYWRDYTCFNSSDNAATHFWQSGEDSFDKLTHKIFAGTAN
jgi:hypothetical protein